MNKEEIKKQLIKLIKAKDRRAYQSAMNDPLWKDGQKFNFGISLRISEMGIELFDAINDIGQYNFDFIHEVHNNRFGEGYLIRFNRDELALPSFKKIKRRPK